MNKFIQWFQNIMQKANRVDDFSQFLVKAGALVGVVGMLFNSDLILWIGFGLILWMYIRTFSKDKQKFAYQNQKFLQYKRHILNKFHAQDQKVQKRRTAYEQRKAHRFYKCPNCKQKVRVPKGHGKISITCPTCKTKFVKKS
ncbi:hypothetical protein [Jeotgalibaca caeni]|uniref:hypothetical protein n=1 Tax=Jeotgalibaca caeni TaxID=3028623 RepID=UPI00237E805F|nr:hypothetical protein [Jeotgalibaca caeni]MDE1547672.1 hypothetical protein [Jeotgalibaca caeni]